MAVKREAWRNLGLKSFDAAMSEGGLFFPGGVERAKPFDCGPYLASFSSFESRFTGSGRRAELLARLRAARRECWDCMVRFDVLIIGGSFLELENATPRDLDCVAAYRIEHPPLSETHVKALDHLVSLKSVGIDIRPIPLDVDDALLIKMIMYFGALYTQSRAGREQVSPLVVYWDE